MRLKTFSAPTMALAMARVRETLGEDAIIVSTRQEAPDRPVTVLAAAEQSQPDTGFDLAEQNAADPLDRIDGILDFHRTPPEVADPLRAAAHGLIGSGAEPIGAVSLLAGALDMHLGFLPLDPGSLVGTVMFVGAPGSGKTVACAKLAASLAIKERPVKLVSTDGDRAGAAARLAALAERISLTVATAGTVQELETLIGASGSDETLIIDTPGTNTLSEEELASLRGLVRTVPGHVFLALPAGSDAYEAAEQARTFAGIGATAILASRLDTGSRYGAILAASLASRLPLSMAGIRPQIGDGLASLNPVALARLLAARCDGSSSPFESIGQPS
jgi:flagellar biosynthesis protein FlhF